MSASALESPLDARFAPLPAPPPVPPLTRAIRSLAFLATEGASIAFAGWSLRAHDNLVTYVASNTLSPHARKFVVGNILGGAAIAGLAGLVVILWRRLGGLAAAERVARRLAPLCLIGPLPLFFRWQLWYGGRELTFLAMISAFLLGLQALLRISLETPPLLPERLRARVGGRVGPLLARIAAVRWLPFAIVAAAVLFYAIYFSVITIQNHFRLQTMGYDLGIDRKSTRLNSSHPSISYAVFCLKKKKKKN